MRHTRCVLWAAFGVLAGCAAYAQDHPQIQTAAAGVDPSVLLLQALQAGGLPAVLGGLGWLLGRGGIPLTVRLSEEDRELVRKATRHLARALDAPATAEAPKDDSLDRSGGL